VTVNIGSAGFAFARSTSPGPSNAARSKGTTR